MRTVGLSVDGHDNDSFMLPENDVKLICSSCESKLDDAYINPEFKLVRRNLDISTTYDGYTIVSEKFRRFCDDHEIAKIVLMPLASCPGFYNLQVKNIEVASN